MSDCNNWRGDQIKATVEQEFRERRSEDSGARSVRGRQPERMLRVIAETTERVDVFRTRRVRTCLSLSVNKIHPSLHEPTLSASFLPYELCYTGAETREGSRNAAAVMSSPTGSPFADVIQSLAGLHQEHHKALMDMRADQERRFCALVQNQWEDRELFRSWMDREVRAGESPTASACGWPQTDWPVRLIPLLTGEAQLAVQQLPVQNLLVYDDLKRAILQRVGRSPEQHRQRFHSLELGENGRPFVMAHQLRDACRRWLLAGEGGVDQIIDRVVLEQFIARLPKKTAQWVQCHRPASLDLAIQLAEDQMVACHGVGETLPSVSLSLPSPSVSPPIFLPRSRAGVVPQTSIHQSLIQPEALDKSCMVRVRCVHGDVVKYPVVLLTIQFRGQKHKVEVAVNPRLRHPLILGTNWPAFKILLGVLCVDASCGKEKPEGEAAVRTGEAEPGPAEAAPGERSAVKRLILTERDDFPLEQSQDESLRNAFDQVRSIDGRPLQSARPPSYPYFAILKDRLYRVTQDAQSKQDTTQLLV